MSFAVKQGLSQAMQIRRKVSIVSEQSPTQSDSPGIEDLNQDKKLKNEGTENVAAAEQVYHLVSFISFTFLLIPPIGLESFYNRRSATTETDKSISVLRARVF